jgi:tripartite-type tricarboxylate transporter receptor subunit TctC
MKPILALLCAAASVFSLTAAAQSFPAKPIRILSTFTAGSVADGAIRLLGLKVSDSIGQPVIVEVQSGGGGVLAAQMLVRAAPDGYTLLHCAPTTLIAAPLLQKQPPYDTLKDFTYITHMADATTSMLATISAPFNNIKEFIAYAKANPGKIAYGSNGVGASYHLEMSLFSQKYGVDLIHVPYKGGQEGLNAAAAGQIPVAFAPAASALAQARAGKVKILAVLSVKRFPSMPDLPSMGEQLSDYEKIPSGDEIVGPAGIPQAIVQRLNQEFVKGLQNPEMRERLQQIGFVPVGNSPEEHLAQIRRDMATMAKGIKAARIQQE